MNVSNNEFGGIEVSRGTATGLENSVLNVASYLGHNGESYGVPAVWLVNGQGTVDTSGIHALSPLTSTTLVKPGETQYYVRALNAFPVSGGEFTNSVAAYWNANGCSVNCYKGITVNVRAKDVVGLTGLSVTVNRTNNGSIVKTAKQSLIDGINAAAGAAVDRSAPIVVQNINYNEAGSSSWNMPAGAVWGPATVPTNVVLTMTFADGTTKTQTLPISTGVSTYAAIAPVDTTAPILTSVSLNQIVHDGSTNYTGAVLNSGKLDVTFTTNEPLKISGAYNTQIGLVIPGLSGVPSTGWTKGIELLDSATNKYVAHIDLTNRADTSSPSYTPNFFANKVYSGVSLYFYLTDTVGNNVSTYYAVDAVGNTIQTQVGSSGAAGVYKFTLDNKVPVIDSASITRSVEGRISGTQTYFTSAHQNRLNGGKMTVSFKTDEKLAEAQLAFVKKNASGGYDTVKAGYVMTSTDGINWTGEIDLNDAAFAGTHKDLILDFYVKDIVGNHYFYIDAFDASGNYNPTDANTHFITVDNENPTANLLTINGKPYSNGMIVKLDNGKINLGGDAQDVFSMNRVGLQLIKPGVSGHVEYVYTDANLYNKPSPLNWTGSFGAPRTANGVNTTVNLSALTDGTYKINVIPVDMAGNTVTTAYTFVLDKTAPVVTVDSIADVQLPVSTRTITGMVTDANTVDSVEVSIDGGVTWNPATTFDGTNWTYNATGLSVATYTLVARATDAAGNTSSSDTSTSQLYWTTFSVLAAVVNNPSNGSQNSGSTPVTQTTPVANQPVNTVLNRSAASNVATTDGTDTADTDTTDDSEVLAATDDNSNADNDSDQQVLAAEDTKGNWSVVNLVLAVVTAILSLVALIGLARRKDGKAARIMTLVPVAIAVIAFLMIENVTASMIWLNWWTALYAVVLAVQVAIVAGLKNSAE